MKYATIRFYQCFVWFQVIHDVYLKPGRLMKRSTEKHLKIQIVYDSSLDVWVIILYVWVLEADIYNKKTGTALEKKVSGNYNNKWSVFIYKNAVLIGYKNIRTGMGCDGAFLFCYEIGKINICLFVCMMRQE